MPRALKRRLCQSLYTKQTQAASSSWHTHLGVLWQQIFWKVKPFPAASPLVQTIEDATGYLLDLQPSNVHAVNSKCYLSCHPILSFEARIYVENLESTPGRIALTAQPLDLARNKQSKRDLSRAGKRDRWHVFNNSMSFFGQATEDWILSVNVSSSSFMLAGSHAESQVTKDLVNIKGAIIFEGGSSKCFPGNRLLPTLCIENCKSYTGRA